MRHAFWPGDYFLLRKDAGPREFADDGRPFPFTEVGGEGVYEIPVGPAHALLKNIVPDFPLCDKSFNQSYSGNDL